MILITTALKEIFPKYFNKKVLFLGEWCKLYKDKETWQRYDSQTVSYHWDDREKLHQDSQYLDALYIKYLSILTEKLNTLHKVNYSQRYWEVFIGVWLYYFIHTIYDRYLSIKALKNYSIEKTYILEMDGDFVPFDVMDFIYQASGSDEWNHYIYSFLITKITQIPIEVIGELQPVNKKTQKDGVFKNIAIRVISILNKRSQIYFNMAYFDKKFRTQLQRSLGELSFFPDVPFNIKRFRVESNKLRNQLTFDQTNNKFEQILNDLIPMLMPKVYLDGYQTLNKKATQFYPKKPKVILTANSYAVNDGFKVWAAQMQEKGAKYFIAQHGGFNGKLFSFHWEHQIQTADYFYSWGWKKIDNDRVKPMPPSKLLTKISYNAKGNILMPLFTTGRYTILASSGILSTQILYYIKHNMEFLSLLDAKILDILKLRTHHEDQNTGWSSESRLQDAGFGEQIDSAKNLKKSFISRLSECRLCITTYPETTFSETMANNYPVLLYFDPNYWELREEAQPYFDELHRVGILHYEAQSLADKVEEIYLDPMAWWQQVEIQTVRENFCQQFAHVGDNPLKEWQDELKYQAGLSEQ